MSVLWMEGFEADATLTMSANMNRKYTVLAEGSSAGGRRGGTAAREGWILKTPNLGNHAGGVVGFNFRPGDNNGDWELIVGFMNESDEQIGLYVKFQGATNNSGTYLFRVQRGATVLGTSRTFHKLWWALVEFKVVLDTDGSNGSYELKVNGVTELNNASTDTTNIASTVWNRIQFSSCTPNVLRFDDLYIFSTSGGINDDFLGEHYIAGFAPGGNGNRNEWSKLGGGGNHYDAVNSVGYDGDSSYLEVSNLLDDQVELFAWGNLAVILDPVIAVMLQTDLRMDSAGSAKVRTIFRNEDTDEATGTEMDVSNTDDYLRFFEILEEDPTRAEVWTVAHINAIEIGLQTIFP